MIYRQLESIFFFAGNEKSPVEIDLARFVSGYRANSKTSADTRNYYFSLSVFYEIK